MVADVLIYKLIDDHNRVKAVCSTHTQIRRRGMLNFNPHCVLRLTIENTLEF